MGSAARIPATTMINAAVVNKNRPAGGWLEGGSWEFCWLCIMKRLIAKTVSPLGMIPVFSFPVLERKGVGAMDRS